MNSSRTTRQTEVMHGPELFKSPEVAKAAAETFACVEQERCPNKSCDLVALDPALDDEQEASASNFLCHTDRALGETSVRIACLMEQPLTESFVDRFTEYAETRAK